jgi:hypothetical protein
MKRILIYAATISVILSSCKKSETAESNKYAEIEKAAWLIGTWENNSPEGNLSETWSKENDSVYNGQSYFIKKQDTLHSEQITLTQTGTELVYRPTVQGQNNNKPVDFKMTNSTDKQIVFENQAHDYPQKIVYNKITGDSLVATISGMQQGKPSSESYPMKKK